MELVQLLQRLRDGEVMKLGEVYGPAMAITDKTEADLFFDALIENRHKRFPFEPPEEAERIARANLGYYAGYYNTETRRRVLKLFDAEHPIIGNLNL